MAQREIVVELFRNGMPCSQIDRALGLCAGTARAYVTSWWLDEKLAQDSAGRAKGGR